MNITMTILFANYNMGVNLTRWLTVETPTNSTTPSAPYGSTYHNSTTPGSNTTKPVNLTETGLDGPYLDYISTIPNLSVALVAQGRSWHAELNRPVSNAIDLLQLSINEFSSSLLQIQPPLLTSRSTIRTIRAGSSLESAQRAWGRILNLPSGDQQNRQPDAEDQFLAPPSNAPVTSPGRVSIAGRVNVKRKRMDREALERRNRLKGLKAHEELWAP
ncbi:hypothetical protein M011DRAFT_65000 [Sporormia fimetaria CBS 119925]|uniref:Uncharacterized protein n=1 Tax=Sporormia fimetaria CBS 119925 TaxID=1340428 RepID=A0A6A6VBS2_9PLEO|nr:hypothetical protein M011DRAFT_65000 [Sporormia fimetaria CBS 119925]